MSNKTSVEISNKEAIDLITVLTHPSKLKLKSNLRLSTLQWMKGEMKSYYSNTYLAMKRCH